MTGEYQHSIDTKGRLFIPANLREELGETIYVTISIEHALAVYSEEAWREKEEKFNALPFAQARRIRPLFVNAAKCTLDAQGRILIPQKLGAFANLKKRQWFSVFLIMPRYGTRQSGRRYLKLKWILPAWKLRWMS